MQQRFLSSRSRKMKIPFNFGKEISKMSIDNEDGYEEIPVILKLKKNVARLLKIFANAHADEMQKRKDWTNS